MHQSDEQLVQSARAGETAAFGQLVERHFGLVFSIALAHLTEPETAEDLAQEVFLRAFLNLEQLDHPRRFPAWLARITRNLAISWLRRKQRSSRLVAMVPLEAMGQDPADTQAKGGSVAMLEQEENAALREALQSLKPRDRELVLLHFTEGLKKAEIAERLGVHPTTVGRQIERALKSMRSTVERTLREGLPTLRAPSVGIVRTLTLITAASAMSGAAKASLAAAAQASAPAVVQMGTLGAVGKLTATIAAGGKIMATGKGLVAAAVVAAGITAGAVHMATSDAPPAEIDAARQISRQPAAADYHRGALSALPEPGRNGIYDLRSYDLSALDLSDSLDALLMADFDARTAWPNADRLPRGFDADRIFELGRNPGLGIRSLHEQGITGRGIGIGIIDQPLLINHEEYAGRMGRYEELNAPPGVEAQMHGSAVASIAVGQTVGVAPEADLHFLASWPGNFRTDGGFDYDFTQTARAIRRMLEINESLPPDRKIRVIAICIGWRAEQAGFNEVTAAAAEARDAGMFVVCSSTERVHGFDFQGLGRPPLADPNDFSSWEPGLFWASGFGGSTASLLVPMDSRTTASPTGNDEYVFYRSGGLSWAIPYVAGLYALACQVDPDITPDRFWELAMRTGVTRQIEREGRVLPLGPIANPPSLIAALTDASQAQISTDADSTIAAAVVTTSRGLFDAMAAGNWDQAQQFIVSEAELNRLMSVPDGSDDLQEILEHQRAAFESSAEQLDSFLTREFINVMDLNSPVDRGGIRVLDNVRWRVRLDGRERTVRVDEMISIDGVWKFLSPPERVVPDSQSDAASRACQENLARLDGATEQWALDQNKPRGATIAIADLVGPTLYLRRVPVCPEGGTYSSSAGPNIFTVGETPTCSHGGTHVLP